MSDLVRLLRAMSRYEHSDASIGDEAADEIERLTAACARMREDCTGAGNALGEVELENDNLTTELASVKAEYESACRLVAQMHHAATGSVQGPRLGVVEDVAAVAAELASARQDAARLSHFEDWLADRVGPVLHVDDVRHALGEVQDAE